MYKGEARRFIPPSQNTRNGPLNKVSSKHMSTARMRTQIKAAVDALPAGRLRVAADFLSYLQERGENAATRELLAIPGFAEDFQNGLKEIRSGRVTPSDKLRRKS